MYQMPVAHELLSSSCRCVPDRTVHTILNGITMKIQFASLAFFATIIVACGRTSEQKEAQVSNLSEDTSNVTPDAALKSLSGHWSKAPKNSDDSCFPIAGLWEAQDSVDLKANGTWSSAWRLFAKNTRCQGLPLVEIQTSYSLTAESFGVPPSSFPAQTQLVLGKAITGQAFVVYNDWTMARLHGTSCGVPFAELGVTYETTNRGCMGRFVGGKKQKLGESHFLGIAIFPIVEGQARRISFSTGKDSEEVRTFNKTTVDWIR
jgi:hypothetical protein